MASGRGGVSEFKIRRIRLAIEDRRTGARLRCIGSDPKRAHGLAPSLVLCDEPSQWDGAKTDAMIAALRTSLGKIPGSRLDRAWHSSGRSFSLV